MNYIDLRSDTLTKPSQAMREAMASAEVGDDVWGEDPTINKLQEKCAELSGKEATLFVTSGCMANQLSIKAHTNPSEEVIVESESHIINYEIAGPSIISGVQLLPLRGVHGVLTAGDIEQNIRPDWYHFPKTSLICLENTHNRAGGTIYPINEIKKIRALALERKLKMHLDGARIFNAVVETGISLKSYASYFDSVSFCFSKGLGAPVGSIICADKESITRAHKYRKILGGGMRQAGILAAAAIYALDNNVPRLKADHVNARYFAEEISKINGVEIDLTSVQTNMAIFKVRGKGTATVERAKDRGILIAETKPDTIRAVFHLDVSQKQTEQAIEELKKILA